MLRLVYIGDQSTGCSNSQWLSLTPETSQCVHSKLLDQGTVCTLWMEMVGSPRLYSRGECRCGSLEKIERHLQGLWNEHFAWLHTGIFTVQGLLPIRTVPDCDCEGSGRTVDICKRSVTRAYRETGAMNTGFFYVDSSTIGAEFHLPFGGTKATGNGHREGAMASSLDIFSEWKAVYVDYSGKLQKAQIDEFKIAGS